MAPTGALDEQLVVAGLADFERAERAVAELTALADPPTALFTAQNSVTIGAVRALRGLGLLDRMAVVGFDDFLLADMLTPPVTVIQQDVAGLGEQASEVLLSRLEGRTGPAEVRVLPTTLVVRGSGEIAPPAPGARRRSVSRPRVARGGPAR